MSSQQIRINGHHLRHFHDISTLGINPISMKSCGEICDAEKFLDKTDGSVKINHDSLRQSLTQKNGFFLNNFRFLGMIIYLMSDTSNINKYQAIRNQLISTYDDLLNKVITLHKRECNQIGSNPNHSSLKYLNLPSKRVMILKHKRKSCDCKVCLRGVELINSRLWIKYGHNSCLKTVNELSQIESLSAISQQWILNKKELILKSINLENIDDKKYICDNYSSNQTYDELLHDMNIIGQLENFGCTFHVSNNFSVLKMIVNASDFYHLGRMTNVSNINNMLFCISIVLCMCI